MWMHLQECASGLGHGTILKRLLQHPADVDAMDFAGQTALQEAAEHGDQGLAELLWYGADVNVPVGSEARRGRACGDVTHVVEERSGT